MLSVAFLVALVLSSGTAVSAHAALSVSLSGAASFTGVDNAVVSAKVTNTGDETLKVLNAPGTVLSKGPTDVFSISSGGGKAPHFRGLFAKYNPSHAKSYTTLAPGQSVVVEHSLAAAYDFTASGAGTYRITSSPEFFIVANGGVKRLSADVSAHTARLSGNLKSKLALENLQVAITAPTCNSTARSELRAAAQGADTLVAQAVAYLNAHSAGTATSRYTTWFGAATIARYAHVQLAFDSLSATSFATDVTYECVTGAVCNPDFVDSDAFTRTDTPGHIWICPAYFEPNDEGETPSGLLVHLGTHWDTVAHTGHWAFGIDASKELASALPDFAIDNADSYEYFAQNDPALP